MDWNFGHLCTRLMHPFLKSKGFRWPQVENMIGICFRKCHFEQFHIIILYTILFNQFCHFLKAPQVAWLLGPQILHGNILAFERCTCREIAIPLPRDFLFEQTPKRINPRPLLTHCSSLKCNDSSSHHSLIACMQAH